ncbi:MAG: hypothetical protein AAF802_09400 [Planctomycetota bacterium]
MEDSGIDQIPNPFSVFAQPEKHRQRQFKWILNVAGLLVLVAGFTAAQLYRSDWNGALAIIEFGDRHQIEDVAQVESWQAESDGSLRPLVLALVDRDDRVRVAAAKRIEREWASWRTLPKSQMHRRQAALAEDFAELVSLRSGEEPVGSYKLVRRLVERLAEDVSWTDGERNAVAGRIFLALLSDGSPNESTIDEDAVAGQDPRHSAIEMPNHIASAWTEWPRRSNAPRIYKPGAQIPRLSTQQLPPILGQTTSARGPAAPVAVDGRSAAESRSVAESGSLRRWTDQLGSPSRIVRRKAIEELSKSNEPHVRDLLAKALAVETDPTLASQIRAVLSDEGPRSVEDSATLGTE